MRNIEDYEENYIKNDFETAYQVRFRRKKVLEVLQSYSHQKILEVGCGMKPLACAFEEYEEYTIVEPSDKFYKNAKIMLKNRTNLKIVHDYMENAVQYLRKDGGEYDYIIVSSLLHEVEDPLNLLICLAQVCSRDTVIHINVPNAMSFHRLLACEMGLIRDCKELSLVNIKYQQHSVFDWESLKVLLKKLSVKLGTKVEILEHGTYFVKPFTHSQMMESLQAGIIDEHVLEGLDKMARYIPELGSELYVNFRIGV